MSKLTLIMDEERLRHVGSHSLSGRIFNAAKDGRMPKEVELEFPQTDLHWRKLNGGPKQHVLKEFNVPCLLENILLLLEKGIKVSVTMNDSLPRPEYIRVDIGGEEAPLMIPIGEATYKASICGLTLRGAVMKLCEERGLLLENISFSEKDRHDIEGKPLP